MNEYSGDWLGWMFLARVLKYAESVPSPAQSEAFAKAQSLEFIAGERTHLLGGWRLKSGNPQAAVVVLAELVDLRPLRHGSRMYLGEALLRLGHVRAAEVAFSRASHSNSKKVLSWLAEVVYSNNYWREAIDVLKKATLLEPNNARL